jgi:hypothetical protein
VGTPLEIRKVQPGVYDVKLEPVGAGYIASARSGDQDLLENPSLSVSVNTPPHVEVVMCADEASIEGAVIFKGTPVERAGVVLMPISGKRPPLVGATGGKGLFSVGAIPPGDYRIYAFDSLENVEYMNPAVLATFGPGTPVHVEPNGRVEGQFEMILGER